MQSDRMNNKKYVNWIKTSLAFKYTKDGLVDFTDDHIKTLHSKIKQNIAQDLLDRGITGSPVACKVCRYDNVKRVKDKTSGVTRWIINCCSSICNQWLEEVLKYHAKLPCPNVEWANTNPKLWPTHPWEVAKIFQPFGCETHTSSDDSDLPGLLTLMMNCTSFHSVLSNISILTDLKEFRNQTMHSKSLEIEDTEMETIIGTLIDLLEDPQYLNGHSPCQESVKKIKQLRDNVLDLSLNKELELSALAERMSSMETDLKDVHYEIYQLKCHVNKVTDSESNPQKLLTEFDTIKESIGSIQQNITKLQAENCKFESVVQTIHDTRTKQKVDELASELRTLSETTGENHRSLAATIQILTDLVKTVENRTQAPIETSQSEVDCLTVSSNEQRVISNTLRTDLTMLTHKTANHEQSIRLSENKIQSVDMKVTSNEKSIANLKTQVTDVEKTQTNIVNMLSKPERSIVCPNTSPEVFIQQTDSTRLAEETIQNFDRNANHRLYLKMLCLQQKLAEHYCRMYDEIPLYQLICEDTGTFDDLYVNPDIEIHEKNGQKFLYDGKNIFHCASSNPCRNIYVTGEPGTGKTIFCERMARNWGYFKKKCCSNTHITGLGEYDLLFFIPLRSFRAFGDIESMINDIMEEDISELIGIFEILIILDGLDEWEPPADSPTPRFFSKGLPDRRQMKGYTIITTSRPWKLLSIRLKPREIDKHLEITGLGNDSTVALAENMCAILNKRYPKNNSCEEFLREINRKNLRHYLSIPVLLTQLVCLWYSDVPLGDSECEIYANSVERQLLFAKERKEVQMIELAATGMSEYLVPPCLRGKKHILLFERAILSLSRLAFQTLLSKDKESTLVFDEEETLICGMSIDVLEMFMKVGLLSKTRVYVKPTKRSMRFNFIHKTQHEFFAALFLVSQGTEKDFDLLLERFNTIDNILEQGQFLKFVFGMDSQIGLKLSLHINTVASADSKIRQYRMSCRSRLENSAYYLVVKIQNLIISCVAEAVLNKQKISIQLEDVVVDDLQCTISSVMENSEYLVLQNVKSICMSTNAGNISEAEKNSYSSVFEMAAKSVYLQKIYISKNNTMDIRFDTILAVINRSKETLRALALEYIQFSDQDEDIYSLFANLSLMSLSLAWDIRLSHRQFEGLLVYLHETIELKELRLNGLVCEDHRTVLHGSCTFTLDLSSLRHLCILDLRKLYFQNILLDVTHLTHCVVSCLQDPRGVSALLESFKTAPVLRKLVFTRNKSDTDVDSLLHVLPSLVALKRLEINYVDFGDKCLPKFKISNSVKKVSFTGCSMSDSVFNNGVLVDFFEKYNVLDRVRGAFYRFKFDFDINEAN